MKRCPHCGAAIKVSAAAFCLECKRPLMKPVQARKSNSGKPFQNERSAGKPRPSQTPQVSQMRKTVPQHNHQTQIKKQRKEKKPWLLSILLPDKKQPPVLEHVPVKQPTDENYDGYYDDRPTDDNAQNKESVDPELIKRIAFIAGGAVILVIISIVIMNLL